MAAGLLIDTDVLIDYLRGHEAAVAFLEGLTVPLFISAVSVGELYSGVREGRERTVLATFLRAFRVVPVDIDIALRGGLFCRDFRKSFGVTLADAFVAATADRHELDFVTLNRKHFPMLKNVSVPYTKNGKRI